MDCADRRIDEVMQPNNVIQPLNVRRYSHVDQNQHTYLAPADMFHQLELLEVCSCYKHTGGHSRSSGNSTLSPKSC